MVTLPEEKSSHKLILVGAGQIGSRHLQGLARSALPLTIELVDPSQSSREIALGRYREIDRIGKSRQSIRAIASLDESEFGGVVDLAIVATGARERLEAMRNLLERVRVRYLVLEKFLFQKKSEYFEAGKLLESASAKAWVNCPRRTFDWARQLRKTFLGQKLTLVATGGSWGLGCNAIHLVDLAEYLLDSTDVWEWDIESLDGVLYDAKRSGYIEFGGTLRATVDGTHRLSLTDDKSHSAPLTIEISGEELRAVISEGGGTLEIHSNTTGRRLESRKIAIPFQSEITGTIADGLLEGGECDLTPFEVSSHLHQGLIAAFLDHMARVRGFREERCPVT